MNLQLPVFADLNLPFVPPEEAQLIHTGSLCVPGKEPQSFCGDITNNIFGMTETKQEAGVLITEKRKHSVQPKW